MCVSLRKEDLGRFVGESNKLGGFSIEVAVFPFFRANRGELSFDTSKRAPKKLRGTKENRLLYADQY